MGRRAKRTNSIKSSGLCCRPVLSRFYLRVQRPNKKSTRKYKAVCSLSPAGEKLFPRTGKFATQAKLGKKTNINEIDMQHPGKRMNKLF